ncbi:MAG: cryptochrome/photolyase family protein, partial [Bacteroidota bacterium]
MSSVHLIFPHQLFRDSPLFKEKVPLLLVEEHLFFRQYPFHKQKIAFHRATMKAYENFLTTEGWEVTYIESADNNSDVRILISVLAQQDVDHINFIDPTDNWLKKRVLMTCEKHGMSYTILDSPLFLNSPTDLEDFFKISKKKYHQTSFYTEQRKK